MRDKSLYGSSILPSVRSVSEVFLNYTKQDQYVELFYHTSEAKQHAKIHACEGEGYFLWHLFMAKRENASHWVIIMAAVCSKCEVLEDLDKCDHVAAEVLKTRVRTAR